MILKYLLLTIIPLCLSGCMSVAYTGVTSVYNHYSIENSLSNTWVNLKAIHVLNREKSITQNSSIGVTTVNHVVLLTGQTRTEEIRAFAVDRVKQIPGVKRVINGIIVGPPISSQTLKDNWITTKIRSQFLINPSIDSTTIKAVTNNGAVFLLGTVTEEMAEKAVAIASHTAGVKRVIRLFEIVSVRAE